MPRRGKSPAGHHVVTDCTGSRRLFYSKSHLSPVPSLLLSKMQTFYWFAFWFFSQRLKTVGHPAFLFILRKAGCPFFMSRKQLFRQLNNQTVAEIFERFAASQTAKGVSDKTIIVPFLTATLPGIMIYVPRSHNSVSPVREYADKHDGASSISSARTMRPARLCLSLAVS